MNILLIPDLVQEIIQYLDPVSLINFGSTNKTYFELIKNSRIWLNFINPNSAFIQEIYDNPKPLIESFITGFFGTNLKNNYSPEYYQFRLSILDFHGFIKLSDLFKNKEQLENSTYLIYVFLHYAHQSNYQIYYYKRALAAYFMILNNLKKIQKLLKPYENILDLFYLHPAQYEFNSITINCFNPINDSGISGSIIPGVISYIGKTPDKENYSLIQLRINSLKNDLFNGMCNANEIRKGFVQPNFRIYRSRGDFGCFLNIILDRLKTRNINININMIYGLLKNIYLISQLIIKDLDFFDKNSESIEYFPESFLDSEPLEYNLFNKLEYQKKIFSAYFKQSNNIKSVKKISLEKSKLINLPESDEEYFRDDWYYLDSLKSITNMEYTLIKEEKVSDFEFFTHYSREKKENPDLIPDDVFVIPYH